MADNEGGAVILQELLGYTPARESVERYRWHILGGIMSGRLSVAPPTPFPLWEPGPERRFSGVEERLIHILQDAATLVFVTWDEIKGRTGSQAEQPRHAFTRIVRELRRDGCRIENLADARERGAQDLPVDAPGGARIVPLYE